MFRTTRFSLALLLAAVSTPVLAESVTVVPVDVSSGYNQADECTPEADPKLLNECICKATISKAQVQGVSAIVKAVIDNQLAQVPEQLSSESCPGKPIKAPASDLRINEVSAMHEVVFQDPKFLSVLVTYSTFNAGAAHPSAGSEGYTFDLSNGKTINPTELLTVDQRAKANEFIQKELTRKYGESLLEETKARTDPYITDAGCENCTLYYAKDGWNLRFQLYAVAPYAAGEPTIVIPTTIIPEPETLLTAGKK